jgi:hypothetical protein
VDAAVAGPGFRFEETSEARAWSEGVIGALYERATPRDAPGAEDLPVFVPAAVLVDAERIARAAGDLETGGVLLGHLRRDPRAGALHVEVTALVEASHTRATSERLSFTADTWTEARGLIRLRARNERMCGWWHVHPAHAWCRDCPIESQRRCRLARGFLSADDRFLHRTVFPAAWSVALVVTRVAFGGEEHALFGWNEGRIERRGYHVVSRPSQNEDAAACDEARATEDSHA